MARKRIGDLLFEAGMLTDKQLAEALAVQKQTKERLGDVLINRHYITEKQLIEVLEFQLGIPHVSLVKQKIDQSILSVIPESLAKRYLVFPLRKERNKLVVAMADPLDYYAIDDLRMSTGFQIEPAIAAKEEVRLYIDRYYGMQEMFDEALLAVTAEAGPSAVEAELVDDDSPVVRMVNQILTQAVAQRASDVHFDPAVDGLRVRFRIDGTMRPERTLPKSMQSVVVSRLKIMANLNIAERRLPQDGRFRIVIEMRQVDIRVATLPTVYGEKMVLRILDVSTGVQSLDQIGLTDTNLRLFQEMLAASSGMILITGPTGSGKTSTLYAGLTERSTNDVNVITIEDPVEYQLAGVNQVAVNLATGLTFSKGLRSVLRQDPDIIMIGEIRDTETAEIAVRAAMTGHLVLSTLHTNDAIATIARLIDMGIEPFLVASALTGVVAQRLVRRICEDCKITYQPTAPEIALLKGHGLGADRLFAGRGCAACGGTGFKGRFAVHEVLRVDEPLRRMILSGGMADEMRMFAKERGFHTMLHDALAKASNGDTSIPEVIRVVSHQSSR